MNIATCSGKWLIGLCVLIAASWAAAADFYVAPDGKDTAPGTQAQPFATVARAQQAVRELEAPASRSARRRSSSRSAAASTSWPSRSSSSRPIRAPRRRPVIYEAAPGERPILSGGRRVSGWKVGEDGRWRVTLDEVKAGKWSFQQLFVDDQRRFVARLPKKGYYRIAGEIKPPPDARGYTQFVFGEGRPQARLGQPRRRPGACVPYLVRVATADRIHRHGQAGRHLHRPDPRHRILHGPRQGKPLPRGERQGGPERAGRVLPGPPDRRAGLHPAARREAGDGRGRCPAA